MKCRVTAAGIDELIMVAVFDQAASLDRDDAIAAAHRRKAMGDDDRGACLSGTEGGGGVARRASAGAAPAG